MRSNRLRLFVGSVLLAASLSLGAAWTARNLGQIPDYPDTAEYLRLAKGQRPDQYRGVVYPKLLSQIDHLVPRRQILHRGARGLVWAQGVQMILSLAALAYFVSVMLPPGGLASERWRARKVLGSALLVLLLWLDPLVSHHNLSILTDSLALSASLVFCAAFSAVLTRGVAQRWAGAVMLVAYIVLANTRPEKNFVLLGTGLATIVACLLLRRPKGASFVPAAPRLIAIGAIVAFGFLATLLVQRVTFQPGKRMPTSEWILHHRVIYPHLSVVYPVLPDDLKKQIRPKWARRYDMNIGSPRKVIMRIAGRADERSRITRRLAAIVARERWARIGVDILADTAENIFATLSFYGRMGVLATGGEETSKKLFRSGGSRYTYFKLSEATPALARAYVSVSGLLVLVAGVALISVLRARRANAAPARHGAWAPWIPWLPVLSFCLMNALVFSLTANLVLIRYTLPAHVAFVAFAYRGFADWVVAPQGARDLAGQTRLLDGQEEEE